MMTDRSHQPGRPIVVGIGEALFDCFTDETALGGAPVNFVFQIQQLLKAIGGQGVVVSRVGDDTLGRQLIGELQRRGVTTTFVQIDRARPTGQVRVTLAPTGEPDYEIMEDVAWDHVAFDDSLKQLASNCSAVCFGTLAQRSAVSRETIRRFLAHATQAIRVVDVNFRQHYFTPRTLESSLAAANVVKLNEEELLQIVRLLPAPFACAQTPDEQAAVLIERYQLDLVALTRGARGAVLFTKQARIEGQRVAKPDHHLADDVGAGDACCAGLIYGLLQQWPHERTVDLANRMGAFVAGQRGGTPPLPSELLELAGMVRR
jgi:fructokinase